MTPRSSHDTCAKNPDGVASAHSLPTPSASSLHSPLPLGHDPGQAPHSQVSVSPHSAVSWGVVKVGGS